MKRRRGFCPDGGVIRWPLMAASTPTHGYGVGISSRRRSEGKAFGVVAFRGSYLQSAALWRAGGYGSPPPALTWQDGEMPHNPVAEVDTAEDELRIRGWIDRQGPVGELHRLLLTFAGADVEADLKFAPEQGREVRVLVALRGRSAARWIIDRGEVTIDEMLPSCAFSALVDVLPNVAPVPGKPVSLRTEDLRAAAAVSGRSSPEAGRTAIGELRRAGVRSDDARNAVRMLAGGRTLQGQAGAAAYTPQMRKRMRNPRIVEVIDTHRGRVIRYQVGSHTTIAPGEPRLVARAVAELVNDTSTLARNASHYAAASRHGPEHANRRIQR